MERKRGEFAWIIGLAALILLPLLARYPLRGFRLPMGPDAPVYMWWAHLARLEGLSVAHWRPGAPALTLMLGEGLGLSQLQVTAGLGAVFAATIGLAAYAAVRNRVDPWVALLAGLLAGAYATHLAGGYFGNIIIASMLMAVVALLGAGNSRRATLAATALLAAGGSAHPMFLLVALAIIAIALPFVARDERSVLIATGVGTGVITGVGLLTMLIGPRPLGVDTSADAFMRRAGLTAELAGQFRSRLAHHLARYVPWMTLPLAWLGRKGVRPSVSGTLLASWAWFCLIGVAASFVIGSIPGVRMIAFAFPLPVFAALGIARVRTRIGPPFGLALIILLILPMLAGGALTWARERPYATPDNVREVVEASESTAGKPEDTIIVFIVKSGDPGLAAYQMTNWGNIIRAYSSPDRVRHTWVYFGERQDLVNGKPGVIGDPILDALSRYSYEDLPGGGLDDVEVFEPGSMDQSSGGTDLLLTATPAEPDGATEVSERALDAVLPTPMSLALTGVLMFVALVAVGFGWSRTVTANATSALALSPAFGAAALILTGVLLDRLGLRLHGLPVPISGLAVGLGGYLALRLSRRKAEPLPGTVPAS